MGSPVALQLGWPQLQSCCVAGRNVSGHGHSTPSHFFPRRIRHSHFLLPPRSCNALTSPSCHGGSDPPPATTRHPPPSVSFNSDPSSFLEILSLDNNPLHREQAITELWRYVLGGKQCVDSAMQCHGFLNCILHLLRSESSSTCDAAAGILRTISDMNEYKKFVVESGALEVITDLLSHSYFTAEGKEQCLSVLSNLAIWDKFNTRTDNKLMLLLVNLLDDEDMKVKEAATRVLANMVLSEHNRSILIEAGLITKLANMVNTKSKECKGLRKEAKKALFEFSNDECYRILVLEEGFVMVPVIGAAAYKSFKPTLHSWPSLPDGTIFEQKANQSSEYGASGLLLGLNIDEGDIRLEAMKIKAMDGRARQQFLVRAEAIETDEVDTSHSERPINQRYSLLPWVDAVARLVLVLGLQELSAVARAADSIADASVNEHMRLAFKEAGAINCLVCLLNHQDSSVKYAAIRAMERLSVSHYVCDAIPKNALCHLTDVLMCAHLPEFITDKVLDVIYRIYKPQKAAPSSNFCNPTHSKGGYLDISVTTDSSKRRGVECDLILPLITILKTGPPSSQRKAASILQLLLGTAFPGAVQEFISAGIEAALQAVFHQCMLQWGGGREEVTDTQCSVVEVEEAALAISASSSLLRELLNSDLFHNSVDLAKLAHLLNKAMASHAIPLRHKHSVAAAHPPDVVFPRPGNTGDPAGTVSTLIERLKGSPEDAQLQKAVTMELNRLVSKEEGGGIGELVKLVEEGDDGTLLGSGLEILHGLSMDDGNRSAMASAGALPAIRKYLFSRKKKRPQWRRTMALRILEVMLEE